MARGHIGKRALIWRGLNVGRGGLIREGLLKRGMFIWIRENLLERWLI